MSRVELIERLLAAKCAWIEADIPEKPEAERRYRALLYEATQHTRVSERELDQALKPRFAEYMRKRRRF